MPWQVASPWPCAGSVKLYLSQALTRLRNHPFTAFLAESGTTRPTIGHFLLSTLITESALAYVFLVSDESPEPKARRQHLVAWVLCLKPFSVYRLPWVSLKTLSCAVLFGKNGYPLPTVIVVSSNQEARPRKTAVHT